MAHLVETMAYAGKTPWHGLGASVSNDLTPEEMLRAAGLDWLVEKQDIVLANNPSIMLEQKALVRNTDSKVLSIIGEDWNPVQNHEAFEFFNDFVLSGNMEMETAGSLKEGKMVWALAKVKDSFKIFMNDEVDSYLLFSNPHQYGKTIDVRFTAIRVVCNNTLSYAMKSNTPNSIRLNHCRKFDGNEVKQILGLSHDKLEMLKQQALFLGSKRFNNESLKEYFEKIFPVNSKEDKISRNAKMALEVVHTQPGANFAEGTFWQAYNAVTYMLDHKVGRNQDTRLHSSWFGQGLNKKDQAMIVALNMAKAA